MERLKKGVLYFLFRFTAGIDKIGQLIIIDPNTGNPIQALGDSPVFEADYGRYDVHLKAILEGVLIMNQTKGKLLAIFPG
jgi:hypothetical protein